MSLLIHHRKGLAKAGESTPNRKGFSCPTNHPVKKSYEHESNPHYLGDDLSRRHKSDRRWSKPLRIHSGSGLVHLPNESAGITNINPESVIRTSPCSPMLK